VSSLLSNNIQHVQTTNENPVTVNIFRKVSVTLFEFALKVEVVACECFAQRKNEKQDLNLLTCKTTAVDDNARPFPMTITAGPA